jgi:hypothetical protein
MLVKDESGSDPESALLDSEELLEVYKLYKEWWEVNNNNKITNLGSLKPTTIHRLIL